MSVVVFHKFVGSVIFLLYRAVICGMCGMMIEFVVTFTIAVVILTYNVWVMYPSSCSRFTMRIAFFCWLNLIATMTALCW